MLGAPLITFLAFQEIQVRTLSAIRDEQARRDELQTRKFGVVRQWEPKQTKETEEIESQRIGEEESLEDDPFPWIQKH